MKKMKKSITILKKSVLILAFTLITTATSMAQVSWGGYIKITGGYNVIFDVTIIADIQIDVPDGVGMISGNIGSIGEKKIIKTGAGMLVLSGTNNYSGETIVQEGSLSIGNGSITGTLPTKVEVKSGCWLDFRRSDEYIYPHVISGAGNICKYNSGKLCLTGTNTYTGETKVEAGTLQLGWDWSGVYLPGSINSTSGVNLASTNATLRFEPDEDVTFSKVISGSGKVEYKGSSSQNYPKLIFTGNNTYTGTTTVEAYGVLTIGNNTTTGAIAGNIVTNDNVWIDIKRSNDYTYSGVISGPCNINKYYSGKLTFTGANSYTGITQVGGGVLQIGNGTSGSINNTSKVELSANTTLRFEPGSDMTFSKVISGTGKVEYKGSGTKKLILTANHTYTGTTTVDGVLNIGNNTTTGAIAGNIIINNNGWIDIKRSNDYTYSGIISGGGSINKYYSGKVTLTGVNTYTGETKVEEGILQIGNGTSGSIDNTSTVNLKSANSTLRFEPGADMTFSKVIFGAGKVEYNGTPSKRLYLTGNNTYTGTTTVGATGVLGIGNNTSTGAIAGNIIINNGTLLDIKRNNDYTYSGVISGAGIITKYYLGTFTLTAVHTFTSKIQINNGILALGASASIETASAVVFDNSNIAKFDISAGNKTIKELEGNSNSEVILGTRTLTLGTLGQNDGGGNYGGKFSGTGGVTKAGTATFTTSGISNTASGTFLHNSGTVKMSGNWAGNYNKGAGSTLEIVGNATIGGTLTLQGGNITMNLNSSPPSKITVTGAVSASGTNTLNIASPAVTNQVLMQAASGITSTTPYTLNMPGMTGTLSVNTPTQLLLTAIITDVTPPTPGVGVNGTTGIESGNLSWGAATDNQTPQNQLRYYVYQSANNNINTVANCETNGTLLNTGGTVNITNFSVNELTPNTNYYFNVLVSDMVNNKAVYVTKSLTTTPNTQYEFEARKEETATHNASAPSPIAFITTEDTPIEPQILEVNISPKSVTVLPTQTQQFTVTVVAVGGADESVTWSIEGNESTLTTITSNGLLTVGNNETAQIITIKATSNFNSTAFDMANASTIEVGINELEFANITVYPNPTTGELKVQSSKFKVQRVEIFDVFGRKVGEYNSYGLTVLRSYSLTTDGMVINLSHLQSGVYFVRIQTEQGAITKKVVKQ